MQCWQPLGHQTQQGSEWNSAVWAGLDVGVTADTAGELAGTAVVLAGTAGVLAGTAEAFAGIAEGAEPVEADA